MAAPLEDDRKRTAAPDPAVSSELLRRAQVTEEHDYQIWSIFILVLLVTAAGFAALVAPNLMWNLEDLHVQGHFVPQLFFGFITMVILFNIYVIRQRRLLRNTREELLHELLQRLEAEKLSLIDPLTKIYNRRYVDEVMSKDLCRAERQGVPVTFVMIDVDRFKSVNSRFGHLTGDRVLTEVAQVLKKTFRGSDTIIRYGGDEFLIAMEGCSEEQAKNVIGRLNRAISSWNERKPITGYEMKLSCGSAVYTRGAKFDDVIDRADQMMLAEKSASV